MFRQQEDSYQCEGETVVAEVESVKGETLVALAPATLAPGSGKLILATSSRRIKIV